MEKLDDRRGSVHISFRVSRDLRDEFDKEAIRQGVNFNSLGNRVMQKYVTFDRLVEHGHYVVIERKAFSKIIEKIQTEDLKAIGKELGLRAVKEDFEFFGIAPTLDNLIKRYFIPMGKFSDRFDCNVVGSPKDARLVLAHEYGRKWSDYLGEYSVATFESVLGMKPKIRVDNDVVAIEFRPET